MENLEKDWKVCIVPLHDGFFYLAYGDKCDFESLVEKPWVLDHIYDDEKEILEFRFNTYHEAFWSCYKKSIEMFETYGIEKVRSDIFSELTLSPPTLCNIHNLISHKVVPSYVDLSCDRCGRVGHTSEVCYCESSKSGTLLDHYSDDTSSQDSSQ